MRRSDLDELQYITPIGNLRSIQEYGILCNRLAKRLPSESLAMPEIQERRASRSVPRGRSLHDYAPLYICARNPMLYKRRSKHMRICVLQISTDVLDQPGVVIADGNAASDYTAFWRSPDGLAKVDRDAVFMVDWRDPNRIIYWRNKNTKCAEVLVPDRVDPRFIMGARVSCEAAGHSVAAEVATIQVTVDEHLFFFQASK